MTRFDLVKRTLPAGCLLASGLFLGSAWMTLAQQATAPASQPSVLDSATQEEIQKFCGSIIEPARDQRYLMQKQELEKLQSDIDSRIAVLEERKAEYEDWLKRRNDFMKQAEGKLVEIYRKMPADAAAPQLQETDAILAAAIIMKLPPRQSSLILAEMEPDKAAIVASIMSSATDPNTSKDPT
jgi:Uncharacterized conserved protein